MIFAMICFTRVWEAIEGFGGAILGPCVVLVNVHENIWSYDLGRSGAFAMIWSYDLGAMIWSYDLGARAMIWGVPDRSL